MALNPNILLGMQPANAGVAGQSFLNSLHNMQGVLAEKQRQKQQSEAFEQQRLLDPIKLEMAEQQVEQGRRLAANQAGLEIHNAAKALRSIADPAQREATLKIMAPELINRFGLSQEDLANGLDDNELDAVIAKTQMFAEVGDPIQERFSPKTVVLEDGTTIQTTSTGRKIVTDISGKQLTGEDAKKAIQKSFVVGAENQRLRATGRTEGALTEERGQGIIDRGISAAESTATIRRGIELLDQIETGGPASISLRAKQLFGVESAEEGELAASLGKSVLSQLKSIFGAAFTAEEGKRLERIEANFGKSAAANKRLLKQTLKISERAAHRAIKEARVRGDTAAVEDIQDLLAFTLTPEISDGDIQPVQGETPMQAGERLEAMGLDDATIQDILRQWGHL